MSSHSTQKRITAPDIRARKGKNPIVSLTSYFVHTARIADPLVDFLLVGDSLGMVVHGFETTLPVTLEMMILHAKAVVQGTKQALIVVDMPFGSYEASPEEAFRHAARIMKETGAGAVKIEGGGYIADTIQFLVERGIPVMGHIGLTPQSVHRLGGFKAQGRTETEWKILAEDAASVEQAGAFSIVLEGIAETLADQLTHTLSIPTIGIGASKNCDGQVLVMEDMLGLNEAVPRFVHKYGNIGCDIRLAIEKYKTDVQNRDFPRPENVYNITPSKT